MEGKPFLGQNVPAAPEFVFLAKDRVDSFYDLSRAVRSGRYRYVRNYTPQKILWQRADYPENLFKSVALHREDYLAGRCNRVQACFWQPKPIEEFYDVENDPWEVSNLIDDPSVLSDLVMDGEEARICCDHPVTPTDIGSVQDVQRFNSTIRYKDLMVVRKP